MNINNKLTVCMLITLLCAASYVGLFMPANAADTWTDITTFPYVITESGNYRLTAPYSGGGLLININASNVVLDGQNYQITQTGDPESNDQTIWINGNCTNVLVKNINQAYGVVGLVSMSSNFTVQDSVFANNSGGGMYTFEANNFTIQRCNLSNNTDGCYLAYASNFTLKDCILSNNTEYGATSYNWTNAVIDNCVFNNNSETGLYGLGTFNIDVKNCVFNGNTGTGLDVSFGNCTISNCTMSSNEEGFNAEDCPSLAISNSNISYNVMGIDIGTSNVTMQDTIIYGNRDGAIDLFSCNSTILRCDFEYNAVEYEWGGSVYLDECNSTILRDSTISNNRVGIIGISEGASDFALINCVLENNSAYAIGAQFLDNCTIIDNKFNNNGEQTINGDGALVIFNVNSTVVTGNTFYNNTNAFLWVNLDDANATTLYKNNIFQNNTYTMLIADAAGSNSHHQFYFYNNLVNDTSYINPLAFGAVGDLGAMYAPSRDLFHLNTTMQTGTRIYSYGGMIGGNFWAHPNGTGPSQIGADADKNGFLDTPFELFNNATYGYAFDNLTYSSSYLGTLSYTAGASQTLAANQTSTVLTVQIADAYGNPTYGTTINLSSNSSTGKFYSTDAATQQITTVTIPAGSSTASFYYKDLTAGTPIITAASVAATSVVTNFTINAHADAIRIAISPTDKTIAAGDNINYTTIAYDVYGNSWDVSATYLIDGNSFTGNQLIGRSVDTYLITATYNDLSDSTLLTVTPGSVSHFIVSTPYTATPGKSFTIRIYALDSCGNTVTDFDDTVSLSASGTTLTPSTSGSFSEGIWTGNVTIATSGSYKIFASDGSGHNGTSASITVGGSSSTPTPTVTPRPTATITPHPSNPTTETDSSSWILYVVVIIVILGAVFGVVVYILKRPSAP